MNRSQLGGLARARALKPKQRSRIAQLAAKARWSKREAGVIPVSEIRAKVKNALRDRKARAFLFGSYARGDATARSDIDILVVQEKVVAKNRLKETALLRRSMAFKKNLDLIVIDEKSFKTWKNEYGSIQHVAFKQGVLL